MNTRGFLLKAVPLLVMILVGIVVIVIGGRDNSTMTIIGSTIEGLAAIFLVSLLFYEVGRSEDRAREADRQR